MHWIKVTEALPELGSYVLVIDKGGWIEITGYAEQYSKLYGNKKRDITQWFDRGCCCRTIDSDIVAWMPLPEEPEWKHGE